MPLRHLQPVCFIATIDPAAARAFYEGTLGLTFVQDDSFALVFAMGPDDQMLRIAKTPGFRPFPFTVLGWKVDDIHKTVAELSAKGVEFLRFSFLEQDKDGVWASPDGAKVAWFKDPDGNVLSLSFHP